MEDSVLEDVPNKVDAFVGDDRCSYDYSSCWVFEKLCDTNCIRHCSMVASAVVPCVASMLALCSTVCHTRHIDDRQSMEVAMTSDSIRSLRSHSFHHDFRFLFIAQQQNESCKMSVCVRSSELTHPKIVIFRLVKFDYDQLLSVILDCDLISDVSNWETSVNQHREIKKNNNNFRDTFVTKTCL